MFRKGYVGAGVRDIVAEAPAPQGSFTNHFRSKEEFAREVLDRYFDDLKAARRRDARTTRSRTPRQRLKRYLDIITERLAKAGFSRGCLIGDFSLEAAPQSEMLRARLAEIFAEWRSPFAACIAEGQAAGEIAATFAPEELAEFLLSSWEGAILRMKVERNAEPLERFKRIAFATVFKEPSHMNPDISLPRLPVLDSEMAYREAGSDGRAGRALPARQSHLLLYLAQHHPARRRGRALHRPGPHRLRPIGQARHRLSLRGSRPLSRRLHREGGDRLGLPRRAGLGNGARLPPRGPPAGLRARPGLHGVHQADAELGGVPEGTPRRARSSASSERRAKGRN